MKILLCLSSTPDTTTKIKFTEDKQSLDTDDVQFVINPYDDHAIASAMEVKEQYNATLTVIHVGESDADQVIRKALAIGADDAIRVDGQPHDAQYVAKQIAAHVADKGYDFIYTGRESIDYNGSMVCDMLAEYLNMPSVNYVKSIELNGQEGHFDRFIDGGAETVRASLPVVVSSTKELAEPRIPNMRGIMQAKKKPLEVVDPVEASAQTTFTEFEPPQAKGAVQYIDAEEAEKLIDILQNQEKVL